MIKHLNHCEKAKQTRLFFSLRFRFLALPIGQKKTKFKWKSENSFCITRFILYEQGI